jgi:hypothetical protein
MTAHGAPSVTTWTRLEPLHGSTAGEGAAARIADPAWLLARQWQLGEFHGSDGGSPASARLRLDAGVLSAYHGRGPGYDNGTPLPYDHAVTPLETLVEREPAGTVELNLRADGGRRFVRLLTRYGAGKHRAAYTQAFALPDPGPGGGGVSVLSGRLPDAMALGAAFRAPNGTVAVPAQPPVPPADMPRVLGAATEFLRWWDSFVDRGTAAPNGQAWEPTRLEHRFALGTRLGPGNEGFSVAAEEYPGGSLDWYDLDEAPDTSSVYAERPGMEIVRTALPTPIGFAGMPANRWWEFEDARVHLGGIESGATDLGRMLLGEFGLLYSCDWFSIPVELPVGTVARVASLVVTDTFNVRTLIGPAGNEEWGMFGLTGHSYYNSAFVLPPTLAHSFESGPVEEVLLLRDEAANLAWAVESIVEGPDGRPIDRHERHLATLREPRPAPPAPAGADFDYRLTEAQPPAHWIPFVQAADAERGLQLRRSALTGPDRAPLGDLLRDTEWIAAEELAGDGIRVVRHWQLARWSDGSTHLWLSRRKYAGRGEASSGTRHDVLHRVTT